MTTLEWSGLRTRAALVGDDGFGVGAGGSGGAPPSSDVIPDGAALVVVRDAATLQPVAGAQVWIETGSATVSTDASGAAIVPGVQNGNLGIHVNAPGYVSQAFSRYVVAAWSGYQPTALTVDIARSPEAWAATPVGAAAALTVYVYDESTRGFLTGATVRVGGGEGTTDFSGGIVFPAGYLQRGPNAVEAAIAGYQQVALAMDTVAGFTIMPTNVVTVTTTPQTVTVHMRPGAPAVVPPPPGGVTLGPPAGSNPGGGGSGGPPSGGGGGGKQPNPAAPSHDNTLAVVALGMVAVGLVVLAEMGDRHD